MEFLIHNVPQVVGKVSTFHCGNRPPFWILLLTSFPGPLLIALHALVDQTTFFFSLPFLGATQRLRTPLAMSEANTPYTPGGATPGTGTPSATTPKGTVIDPKMLPQLRQAFPDGIKDPNMYPNLSAAVAQQTPQQQRSQYPPQYGYTQQFSQPYQQAAYSR